MSPGRTRIALAISPLQTEEDARACAQLMAASEPWITLGRSYETSLGIIQDPSREVYLARDEAALAGFNLDARRLYERLGYTVVGELTDFIVRGHSEFLLRKTLGPLTGFGSGMAHPPA